MYFSSVEVVVFGNTRHEDTSHDRGRRIGVTCGVDYSVFYVSVTFRYPRRVGYVVLVLGCDGRSPGLRVPGHICPGVCVGRPSGFRVVGHICPNFSVGRSPGLRVVGHICPDVSGGRPPGLRVAGHICPGVRTLGYRELELRKHLGGRRKRSNGPGTVPQYE